MWVHLGILKYNIITSKWCTISTIIKVEKSNLCKKESRLSVFVHLKYICWKKESERIGFNSKSCSKCDFDLESFCKEFFNTWHCLLVYFPLPGLVKPFSPLENTLQFLISTKAVWPPSIIIIPKNLCILSVFLNVCAVVLFYRMYECHSTFWHGCFNCKASFKGEMQRWARRKRTFEACDVSEIDLIYD